MTSVALAYLRLGHLRSQERAFAEQITHSLTGARHPSRAEFRRQMARDFWGLRRSIAAAQRDLHTALDAQMAEAA